MNRIFTLLLTLVALLPAAAQSQLRVGTYNVDGLPGSILTISINPEGPGTAHTPAIADHLENSGWDIIGMNEDFNFHDLLTAGMPSYEFQTYQGRFEGDYSLIGPILAKTHRFAIDGLELAVRRGHTVTAEDIVPWRSDAVYGYLTNAQDSLTMKGFRYYGITTAEGAEIDVIILHADAGYQLPDRRARENGQDQLCAYIEERLTTPRPLIIMGDFNCLYFRDDMKARVIDRLNAIPGFDARDAWVETHNRGQFPEWQHPTDNDEKWRDNNLTYTATTEQLDKILYVNRSGAATTLTLETTAAIEDWLRPDGVQLSDHLPVQATFSVNTTGGIDGLTAPATLSSTHHPLYDIYGRHATDDSGITIADGRKTVH